MLLTLWWSPVFRQRSPRFFSHILGMATVVCQQLTEAPRQMVVAVLLLLVVELVVAGVRQLARHLHRLGCRSPDMLHSSQQGQETDG